MLKIRFIAYKNVIMFEVLEQTDRVIRFASSEGHRVYTSETPALDGGSIYLRGNRREADNYVYAKSCVSEDQVETYMKSYLSTLEEYARHAAKTMVRSCIELDFIGRMYIVTLI